MVLIRDFNLILSQHISLYFLINMELNIDQCGANPEALVESWMMISAGLIQSWSLRNPRLPSLRLREACHVIFVITITLGSKFSNCSCVYRPCHRSVKPLKPCERACCNQGVPGSLIFTIGSHFARSNAKTKHFHRSWMIIKSIYMSVEQCS